MCFALDIDETLATKVSHDIDNSYFHFVKQHFPEQIIPITLEGETYHHVLCHGALEAVRFLLKAGCRLALYSSGMDKRNQAFKTELLKRALSKEDFEKYHNQVQVLSREEHLFDTELYREERYRYQPELGDGMAYGNQKKDLNYVISAFAKIGIKLSLDQIILIDDDLSWMLRGQEKNFLIAPGCTVASMEMSLSKNNMLKINQIFYCIGLLSTIFKSDKPLDTLFELQFNNKKDYSELPKEMGYYKLGLELLRTVNKDLQLIDKAYIKQISRVKKLPAYS